MRFSSQQKQASETDFQQLSEQHRTQVMARSVQLTSGGFSCSGVLCLDEQGRPCILTAKHNLPLSVGMPMSPTDWSEDQYQDMVTSFLERLHVHFAPPSLGQAPQHNSALNPETTEISLGAPYINESWDYDLILIYFDPECDLGQYMLKSENHYFNFSYLNKKPDEVGFYRDQNFLKSEYKFVTGFGWVENTSGKKLSDGGMLQVRTAPYTEGPETVIRDPEDAEGDAVLITEASNESSTAPGDSGGPMMCVYQDKLYLLGTNLGANFFEDHFDDNDDISNNAATYLVKNNQIFLAPSVKLKKLSTTEEDQLRKIAE